MSRVIDVEEKIKSLKRIKLVIGNGFDLHCGLATNYKDYFIYIFNDSKLKKWKNSLYESHLKNYIQYHQFYYDDFPFKNALPNNIWELFFYLVDVDEKQLLTNVKWSNIEYRICNSLKNPDSIEESSKYINWQKVYMCLNNPQNILVDYNYNELACAAYIKYRIKKDKEYVTSKEFYDLLLKDLKLFEKSFGDYIYKQMNLPFYRSRAGDTISYIVKDIKNLVSIDSFNYSTLSDFNDILFNINGDFNKPVFGIDPSSENLTDYAIDFTKTFRNSLADMENESIAKINSYENIIIYGHSLALSDRSYFFTMFDDIRLFDLMENSVLVFAYSIVPGKTREECEHENVHKLYNLICEYEKTRGYSNGELYDRLFNKKRIIYELI